MKLLAAFLTSPKLFPSVMITLSVAAAIRYGFARDWRHVLYYVASAMILSSVTY